MDHWPQTTPAPWLIDLRPAVLAQASPIPGAQRWSWAQLRERRAQRTTEPVLVIGTGLDDAQLAAQCGAALTASERAGVQVLRGGVRQFNHQQPFADDLALARIPATLAWAALQRQEAVLATPADVSPASSAGDKPRLHTDMPTQPGLTDFWIAGGEAGLRVAATQSQTGAIARETALTLPCDQP